MPFRRRYARRASRRPRTRWLAIVPGAATLVTNNNATFSELTLQDSSGTVNIESFVGGTLLRAIVNLVFTPTTSGYDSSTTFAEAGYIDHVGLFMTADDTPPVTFWSPNSPSGDYMIRDTYSLYMYNLGSSNNQGAVHTLADPRSGGRSLTLDTNVKRRIRENYQLFLGQYYFETGAASQLAVGWTGRVLIQLP